MKPGLIRKYVCILILGATFVVGCGNPQHGLYASEKNPANTAELRSDGTFLVTQEGRSFTGKYRIDGKKLLFEMPTGLTVIGSIEGNVMIDDEGQRYVKK